MPANKRRSRNGNGNSISAQANLKQPTNSITNFFNNINGFANGSNYNGYHHPTIVNHQVNPSVQLNPTVATVTAIGANTNGSTLSTFTAKQQQQLDRNAFLLTLTKDQLKVECRKRGQKTTGTKTELVPISLPHSLSISIFISIRALIFLLNSGFCFSLLVVMHCPQMLLFRIFDCLRLKCFAYLIHFGDLSANCFLIHFHFKWSYF